MCPEQHEIWREAYRHDRYMDHLSQQDLDQRMKDVFLNLTVLTPDTKIGLPPASLDGKRWMISFTDLLEEYQLRRAAIPSDLTSLPEFPHPDLEKAQLATAAIRKRNLSPGRYLFKFSKAKYLSKLIDRGEILINPASYYQDPTLNHAIRDDELSFTIHPDPRQVRVQVFDPVTGLKKGELPLKPGGIKTSLQTDYYVYCMASSFDPRLFLDFEADACLIIHKPNEFESRLATALEQALPGWTAAGLSVEYVDPIRTTIGQVDVFKAKHFRFSYQKEYRVVVLPPELRKDLVPLKLTVPNLGEACELILLD